jgi:predicted kinase
MAHAQPTLYLFVGYPGAGKTTVAQIICGATGAVHLWADYERRAMFVEPTHDQNESRQLYGYLNGEAHRLLKEGRSVVFDTNFNFYKDREHMRRIAGEAGAQLKLIWLQTGKDLAKHRATNDSHNKPTRLYGNMNEATFERIAGHLEPPRPDERPIVFIGENLQKTEVLRALNLL